jgi:voltage-gated potassium channel
MKEPGPRIELAIQVLIVLSTVTFSIETLPDLSRGTRDALAVLEIAFVVAFATEYLARIVLAERRLGYVFSFYGLIDLLAILPSVLAVGIDLRFLRVVRLLRVLRLLKLVRYSESVARFHLALRLVRSELILFGAASTVVIYLAGVGIYFFENQEQPDAFSSVFDGIWWAVATLTTVGYGDAYPVTAGGRAFTMVILVVGLGFISVPTGLIASALGEARRRLDTSEAS